MARRTSLKRTASLLLVCTLIVPGTRLLAQESSQSLGKGKIVGVWKPVVTIQTCDEPRVNLLVFQSQTLFSRDGNVVENNGLAPGLGTWQHLGPGKYTEYFEFLELNPDRSLAVTIKVTSTITLSSDGDSFTSEERSKVVDPLGNVVSEDCGVRTATRMK